MAHAKWNIRTTTRLLKRKKPNIPKVCTKKGKFKKESSNNSANNESLGRLCLILLTQLHIYVLVTDCFNLKDNFHDNRLQANLYYTYKDTYLVQCKPE